LEIGESDIGVKDFHVSPIMNRLYYHECIAASIIPMAEKEPTYLMAAVVLVTEFQTFNLNP